MQTANAIAIKEPDLSKSLEILKQDRANADSSNLMFASQDRQGGFKINGLEGSVPELVGTVTSLHKVWIHFPGPGESPTKVDWASDPEGAKLPDAKTFEIKWDLKLTTRSGDVMLSLTDRAARNDLGRFTAQVEQLGHKLENCLVRIKPRKLDINGNLVWGFTFSLVEASTPAGDVKKPAKTAPAEWS